MAGIAVHNHEDYAYRSAININNIGCLLLEKGAFEQARETFTDCLFLLQRLTSLDDSILMQDYSFQLQSKLMRKATQRMAFPRAMKISCDGSSSFTESSCPQANLEADCPRMPSSWKVMSMFELNEFTAVDEIICAGSDWDPRTDRMVICSFRIEDVSSMSHGSNLGKVLFNLGTSYAALARCCVNGAALQTFAIKVFLLADRSLHLSLQSWCSPEDPERNNNNHAARSIACARLATLHGILQICVVSGNDTVDDILCRMHELHNAVRLNERLTLSGDTTSAKTTKPSADYSLPAASA